MIVNKFKILLLMSVAISTAVFADYKSELEALSISDLTVAESALIVEMEERADQTYQKSKISRFAFNSSKREADKKRLIENTLKLISAKIELNKRVSERIQKPSYSDKAVVILTDIAVISDTDNKFDSPSTLPTNLFRGGIQKNIIISDFVNLPLTYRVTYSENGTIRVQGEMVEKSKKTNFTIQNGDDEYNVSANIFMAFSEWD